MPKYNIIYNSPANDSYLWNGTSLDKLEKKEQEVLRFSGKSFKEDELDNAIKQCRSAVQETFPADYEPKIKTVLIKVSD